MSAPDSPYPTSVLATLRHDLRTPLNHIMGYSEMLLEDLERSGPGEIRSGLESIRSTARQLLALIQNALSPGRPSITDSDVRALRRALAKPLNRIIRDASALVQHSPDSLVPDLLKIGQAAIALLSLTEETVASQPARIPTPVLGDRPAATGHLLIVDDNEMNRDVLARQLQRQGFTSKSIEDGETALRELRQHRYDLVLLDVMMPGLDGSQVLERMKSDDSTREIPVLMVSALDELDSVVRCIQIGADDYLFKPFDPILLRARIDSLLERKRLRDLEKRRTEELEATVAQLQTVERELRESNQELERFAGAVSHDLQEPLRTITSYIQLLQRQLQGRLDERAEEFIGYAVDAARRMTNLIDGLLDYAHASSGKHQAAAIDAGKALREAVDNLGAAITESGATVQHDQLPTIVADPVQLARLFQNLVGNAIKYRRADVAPAIRVSTERQPDGWLFAVRDNGIGIEQKYLPRIFGLFQRLHGQNRAGAGVGLATCQRIVERMGGRIWPESEPGVGSTFYFTVPDQAPVA